MPDEDIKGLEVTPEEEVEPNLPSAGVLEVQEG